MKLLDDSYLVNRNTPTTEELRSTTVDPGGD